MDFDIQYTKEQEEFRQEVRAWLDEYANCPPELGEIPIEPDNMSFEMWQWARDFQRKLGAKGWLYPLWAAEHGGGGLTAEHDIIIKEELHKRKYPVAYSMANMDGRMYICSYPGAMLSVYDPSRPYVFGKDPDSNPRELGRVDEVSYRPRSMVAGPLGRVWTASVPNYGMWGGPLSWYDPATERFGTYRDIAGEASCWMLAWLSGHGLLAVGTTIDGGTGTQPRVDQATLFLWDYEAEEKVWESTLSVPATAISALAISDEGLLYGTAAGKTGSFLFAFDPDDRHFVHTTSLPGGRPLDHGLQTGPEGSMYGFTTGCFFRFDPSTSALTTIHEEPGAFQNTGPMDEDGVYFTKKHELKKLTW